MNDYDYLEARVQSIAEGCERLSKDARAHCEDRLAALALGVAGVAKGLEALILLVREERHRAG